MIEAFGDLFELARNNVLVITTNGFVKKNGEAVMGRGCALTAKQLWSTLPMLLGDKITREGNKVHVFPSLQYSALITFPVKHHWEEQADLKLIEKSSQELRALADSGFFPGNPKIFVPSPGCGNGHLAWAEVKPVIEKYFDDRFTIVDFQP